MYGEKRAQPDDIHDGVKTYTILNHQIIIISFDFRHVEETKAICRK